MAFEVMRCYDDSAEELDMVKNCKVTKDGNFVTMIIGEKASDMLTMFNDSIK